MRFFKTISITSTIFIFAIMASTSNAQKSSLISTEKEEDINIYENKIPEQQLDTTPNVKVPSQDIISGTDFSIEWTKVEGAQSYEIQMSLDSSFTKRLISSNSKELKAIFAKDAKEKTLYYIRVRGINQQSAGPWSDIAEVFVIPAPAKALPKEAPVIKYSGKNILSRETVYIEWQPVKGVSSYEVQIDANNSFSTDNLMTAGNSGTKYKFCKYVSKPVKFYLRVRGQTNQGYGPWSKVITLNVIPR